MRLFLQHAWISNWRAAIKLGLWRPIIGREHFKIGEIGRISTLMLSKRTLKIIWKSKSFYCFKRSSSRTCWDRPPIALFIRCLAKKSRVKSRPSKVSPTLFIQSTNNGQVTTTRRQLPPVSTLSPKSESKPPRSINKITKIYIVVSNPLRKKECKH